MNPITMRVIKTEELHFINKLDKNGMKINIGNQYAYNVQYSAENLCRGEFTAEVFSKQNPEQFSIKIVQQATFSYDPALSKEEIHRLTYKEIFPYVRAAITGVTAGAGIPPIYIPYVDTVSYTHLGIALGQSGAQIVVVVLNNAELVGKKDQLGVFEK